MELPIRASENHYGNPARDESRACEAAKRDTVTDPFFQENEQRDPADPQQVHDTANKQ